VLASRFAVPKYYYLRHIPRSGEDPIYPALKLMKQAEKQ
jgi:hypothetical protein